MSELFTIPNSWQWSKIGEIGQVISGGTPSTKKTEYFNGNIPWLTPADLAKVRSKYVEKGERSLSEIGLSKSSAVLLPEGTIIFSSRAPIGYTVIAKNPIATNQGCKNLIPAEGIFNEFLYYYLKGNKELAESLASGTTFLELSAKRFSEIPIPIPPTNEQRRIATKLDELFMKLDAGVEELKQAGERIKQYRQSVLTHAFNGKLTKKWRYKNSSKLNPVKEWIKKNSIKTRNKQYKIPDEWEIVLLEDISDAIGGYAFKSSDYSDKGYQIVKIGNVKPLVLKLEDKPTFIEKVDLKVIEGFILEKDDILITLTGTRNKRDYGFSAMIRNEENLLLNQRVARLRFNRDLSPKFYLFFLQADYFRNQFFNTETGNVGQGNVSMKSIKKVFVPLPTIEEQRYISEETERHFSNADKAEEVIGQSLKQAEALRQSILKKAFEGRLVPQDPNDEPASVLLERIKAEKEKLKAKPKNTAKSHRQKAAV